MTGEHHKTASVPRTFIWFALYTVLVLLTGCAGHHTSPRTAHLLDDKVITERVEVALRQASPDAFSGVQVATADGVVTLSGSVPNEQAKARAAQLAHGVEKVSKVENRLQIR